MTKSHDEINEITETKVWHKMFKLTEVKIMTISIVILSHNYEINQNYDKNEKSLNYDIKGHTYYLKSKLFWICKKRWHGSPWGKFIAERGESHT